MGGIENQKSNRENPHNIQNLQKKSLLEENLGKKNQ